MIYDTLIPTLPPNPAIPCQKAQRDQLLHAGLRARRWRGGPALEGISQALGLGTWDLLDYSGIIIIITRTRTILIRVIKTKVIIIIITVITNNNDYIFIYIYTHSGTIYRIPILSMM